MKTPLHAALLFGTYSLHPSQVFYESVLSRGIVNLKPIVPGHVLLIPKRVCARFADLTEDEVCDLYLCAHRIVSKLETHYNCSAINIAMQDGADAGQSVPHVHVHLLPRKIGDFEVNDQVYEELDKQNLNRIFDPSLPRFQRSVEEMGAESLILRSLFEGNKPAN